MRLKERIENNAVLLIAAAFAAGASLAWVVADEIRVKPIQARMERPEKYDIPSLVRGSLAVPEPRQQCEIVKLYEQLSIAIETRDDQRVSEFYSKNYRSEIVSRYTLLQSYEDLAGKRILFYVSLIRHNDDGTVTANVKAFLPSGQYIDSKDTLIYENTGWKFVE